MRARLSRFILRLLGWRIADLPVLPDRFVLIGYPHTSNADFFIAILARAALGFRFNFVAKDSLFWWPLGVFMRALGGIPVDRSNASGFIEQAADLFRVACEQDKPLILAMMPEGTRSYRPYWRSGFYYIAKAASVPIVPGYLDFKTRTLCFGEQVHVTGDLERDLATLAVFYEGVEGRFPEKAGPIAFKPR